MACRFIYQGKEYDQDSLVAALKKMPPEQAAQFIPGTERLPDMPFKSTWPDLALKRMIREAAEKNYDAISWTPGEAQAARYDLSRQVHKVTYDPVHKDFKAYSHNSPGQPAIHKKAVEPKDLPDIIGKEASQKLLEGKIHSVGGYHELVAQELKIGGEGMKAFYDKMLVDKANALGKKYGARVEFKDISRPKPLDVSVKPSGNGWLFYTNGQRTGSIGAGLTEEQALHIARQSAEQSFVGRANKKQVPTPVIVMKLTPAMKRAALREGFPLFSGAPLPTGAVEDRQERKAGGAVHKVALAAIRRMK